jgi:hypothetical protein
MFPTLLIPNAIEQFSIGADTIEIPKCVLDFRKWTGDPVNETFGGKALIDVDGKPMFAELAIRDLFIKSEWQARWIETYGKSKEKPLLLAKWKDEKYRNQIAAPIKDGFVTRCLSDVAAQNNGSYFGCWDVLGWKDARIIFAESKRTKRDSIRQTQTSWLAAGLKSRLAPDNFLIVQWDFDA